MPGSSRGTRRDLRALLGVRRVGSGLGRARGRRAEEGAHRFGSWVAAAGVCQTANKRSIWPAEAAAREERCCRRPSECPRRCAGGRNRPKSHYWFQARGQLASCKTLASKRFVLRRTSAPPRRRSHAYLAPARLCAAGGLSVCMQASSRSHKALPARASGTRVLNLLPFDECCGLQHVASLKLELWHCCRQAALHAAGAR